MFLRSKTLLLAPALLFVGLAYAASQWVMQPKQSELTFTATQAGAPFQGKFEKFSADISFDPANIASSRLEVKIDLRSVDSKDSERDDTLKGPDLFAVEKWPT